MFIYQGTSAEKRLKVIWQNYAPSMHSRAISSYVENLIVLGDVLGDLEFFLGRMIPLHLEEC